MAKRLPAHGRVTVILPTRDEVHNIDEVVARVLEEGDRASLDVEVLVVDDTSTDGTRERVRGWESRDARVRLLARDAERGLAGAVLAGARFASGEVIVVMDADLSHPASAVAALARPVLDGACDMAIGSRYIPGGATPGWPFSRRLISRTAATLARLLVDVRDPCSGFFAVRKQTLLEARKAPGGFKIGLEILARSQPGQRVEDIPITFRTRAHGASKLDARVVLSYLAQLVDLVGAGPSGREASGFALAAGLGFLLDIAIFHALLAEGAPLALAHLTSFAAAISATCLLGAWAGFPGRHCARGSVALTRYGAFIAVALLAVLLRGGVLALAHRSLGLPAPAAIVPAALVAAMTSYIGGVFFAFRASDRPKELTVSWRLAALGVSAYLLGLRCVYAGVVELLPEEAYYWNYSRHLDLGYLDHPPMVAWLVWLGTAVFGQSEWGVRAGALAASLVALYFSVRLAANLLGRPYAYAAALLFAVLPFLFGTGFFMTPDAPLVASWAGALYYLEGALLGGRPRAWLGAGICVGLGLLAKYTILLVPLAALVYLLLSPSSRRWLRSPRPYAASLVTLALASPMLLWNAQHGWVSFVFQGSQRWSHAPRFELATLLSHVLLLITPLGVAGFLWGVARSSAKRRYGLVFTLVPLSVFVLSSFRNETKFNWTGPVWLAALPFMAASVFPSVGAADGWRGGPLQRFWKPTVIALMLFYGALFHYDVLGWPGVPRPLGPLGKSWRALSHEVEEVERRVRTRTGQQPLIVGMDKYNLASELAFYARHGSGADKTTSDNLFGRQGLMYDFWFPPGHHVGRSLILVGKDRQALEAPHLGRYVASLGPIRELPVGQNGAEGRRYFVRVAHGYRGRQEP